MPPRWRACRLAWIDPLTGTANKFLGTHIPTLASNIDTVAHAAGLPREANATERVVGDVTRAVGLVGTQAGAGKLLGAAADSPLVANVANQFAQNMGMQVAQRGRRCGGIGCRARGRLVARRANGRGLARLVGWRRWAWPPPRPPKVRALACSIHSGAAKPSKLPRGKPPPLKTCSRARWPAARPTRATYSTTATWPGSAGANTPAGGGVFPVGQSPIPGVTRTLPERTQNPDVAQTYRQRLRDNQAANGPIIAQEGRNTQARNNFMAGIVGDQGTINSRMAARDTATTALYNQANEAVLPVDAHLQEILATPSGRQAVNDAQTAWNNDRNTRNLPFIVDAGNGQQTITGQALQRIKFALDGITNNSMSSENRLIRRSAGSLQSEFMDWACRA